MSNHIITLENCTSYATEANLDRALARHGLDSMNEDGPFTLRFIKCLTPAGRWTAIFLVSEYFRRNQTGGYVGFASQHGFMSI